MQVSMKAKQIREIKPYRYFQMSPDNLSDLEDYEFVFSKNAAYKINIHSGETVYQEYGHTFKDYCLGQIPDDMEVYVDISVYQHWIDTKELRSRARDD